MIGAPIIGVHMEPQKREFFMMSVEIRILASILARVAGRSIEERFSAHNADISGMQYGILRTLAHQSYTLSELSRRFVVDPSTLVPVIDALERKGLVTRGRDPADRRRIPLTLTEGGTALIQNMPFVHEDDLLFKILDGMGEEKCRQLLSLLREVVRDMPEGEEMVQSISSRLYVLKEGGEPAVPHQDQDCVMRRNELENEHRHMIRRTNRRRIRRNRS
jgi:DNA-binding MarR family transcriptional regulator